MARTKKNSQKPVSRKSRVARMKALKDIHNASRSSAVNSSVNSSVSDPENPVNNIPVNLDNDNVNNLPADSSNKGRVNSNGCRFLARNVVTEEGNVGSNSNVNSHDNNNKQNSPLHVENMDGIDIFDQNLDDNSMVIDEQDDNFMDSNVTNDRR